MTATMSMPQAKINAQDIVAANVNLMITARHLQKKDLANALGIPEVHGSNPCPGLF